VVHQLERVDPRGHAQAHRDPGLRIVLPAPDARLEPAVRPLVVADR